MLRTWSPQVKVLPLRPLQSDKVRSPPSRRHSTTVGVTAALVGVGGKGTQLASKLAERASGTGNAEERPSAMQVRRRELGQGGGNSH